MAKTHKGNEASEAYEVFVLGAGFSKAFNENAPLIEGFLQNHDELLNNEERFAAVGRFINDCTGENRMRCQGCETLPTAPQW